MALTLVVNASAQQRHGKIAGRIVDGANGKPLEGATITVMEDSSGWFVAYAISNRKGNFTLSGLPLQQKLGITVTIHGYHDATAAFSIKDAKEPLQTGDWELATASEELDSVVVSARRPPFVIRNDTLEFNAAAFKSLPNEVVQDLLRKLPGVHMDASGTIYVHGKKVDRILVDGKEFFSGDLKTATRHLPGSIIDKVQITETKNPAREFSSIIKPLTTTVTMNLTIRKENKSGFFGNVNAAGGTRDRYQAGAFLNSFSKEKRLSINGATGNGPSLHPADSEQSSGIAKSISNLAIHYNDDIGHKGSYALTYGYNSNRNTNTTTTERINLLSGNSFLYNSVSTNNLRVNNHLLQGRWKLDIDSLQKLEGTASASMTKRTTELMMNASSKTIDGEPINTQQNLNQQSVNPAIFYENMIHYNRYSRNHKTIISVNWRFNGATDDGAQTNLAQNDFATGEVDSIDQRGDISTRGMSHNFSINVNQSIGKYLVAILHYNYDNRRQNDERNLYRLNMSSGKYDVLDSLYSNHIRTANGSHQGSASLGYKAGKLAVELSAVLLALRQQNRVVWRDSLTHTRQNNVSPNAAFSYTFSPLMRFVGNYSLTTMRPSADQLNPVTDVTNPLVIKVGNPLLRAGIIHMYNGNFNFYSHDMKWRSAAGFGGSFVKDQVVEDTRYDSSGRQVISFRNVNGNRNYGISWNSGVQLQLNQYRLSLEVNTVAANNIAVAFINGEPSTGKTVAITPSLHVQVSYKTILNLHANMSYEANRTTYSLPDISPIDYHIKRLHVMASVSPVKKVQLMTSLFHTYNSQLPPEFQRTRTYMSAAVTANFLKAERLTAGLIINDLLNNNVSTTRTVSAIAIETTQTNALKRYAMVSLSYRLNDFK